MEAVIRDGGHQYRVSEGATLDIEFRDAEAGSSLEFSEVLYVGGGDAETKVGSPTVVGACVRARVVGPIAGDKLVVTKFRRRKGSRTRTGHRQRYLRIQIEKIEA